MAARIEGAAEHKDSRDGLLGELHVGETRLERDQHHVPERRKGGDKRDAQPGCGKRRRAADPEDQEKQGERAKRKKDIGRNDKKSNDRAQQHLHLVLARRKRAARDSDPAPREARRVV